MEPKRQLSFVADWITLQVGPARHQSLGDDYSKRLRTGRAFLACFLAIFAAAAFF